MEAVLPRLRRGGRCPHFGTVVIASAGIVVEGSGVARPFRLAVVAVVAGPTARATYVIGKYGCGERGRVEASLVEAFRHRRGVGHGVVAGAGPLPLELDVNPWLQVVEREVLPSMLDLHIGESETILQRAGHLQRRN